MIPAGVGNLVVALSNHVWSPNWQAWTRLKCRRSLDASKSLISIGVPLGYMILMTSVRDIANSQRVRKSWTSDLFVLASYTSEASTSSSKSSSVRTIRVASKLSIEMQACRRWPSGRMRSRTRQHHQRRFKALTFFLSWDWRLNETCAPAF